MTLKKIMSKRSLNLLGLNSGTSADGLDLALLKITRRGKSVLCKFIGGESKRYPDALRRKILKLADANSTSLEEIISTDQSIGEFFGRTAAQFENKLSKTGVIIDAVASHGQTVRHIPDKNSSGTLQLGSLEQIASRIKKITIGDFRQADIAAGNEGAPITVAAMHRLFSSTAEPRLIVNIGGIANYFYFPKQSKMENSLAGDCGPGNVLCDILSEKLFKKKFDADGSFAQNGIPSKRILTLLFAEPFFKSKTISTGRETFGQDFAERIVKLGKKFSLKKEDIISTSAELTIMAIANKLKPILHQNAAIKNLYLTGGGRKNKFFVKRLKEVLKDINILPADKLGVDADFIEAASYAVMGEAALRSEPLPTVFTGEKTKRVTPVLGKIVQPPVK